MTAMHYISGDEIQPGDTVECADGVTGVVTMVMTSGPEKHPAFPAAADRFFVKRSDGTDADYPPSEPSVKLLFSVKRMTSPTMHATIKKTEFLDYLKDLGSHSLYYPDGLSKRLAECGLSTAVAPDGQGLIIEGQLIPLSTPEWGEPGISTLSVLSTVYELATGEPPSSNMTGRGFTYRHVMNQLATFWGIDAKYG